MSERAIRARTCIGCQTGSGKRDLVRVVRGADGVVSIDPTGKANGRGAYVCAKQECFEAAVKRRRFGPALRAALDDEDVDRLRAEFDAVLATRAGAGTDKER